MELPLFSPDTGILLSTICGHPHDTNPAGTENQHRTLSDGKKDLKHGDIDDSS